MKKLVRPWIASFGIAASMLSVAYAANAPIEVYAKLKATDKDSDSECGGDRSSEEHLEMVHFPAIGNRNAQIEVVLEKGSVVPLGYPKWNGNGLQGDNTGSLVAQWKAGSSDTVTVELCPGDKREIRVNLTPEFSQEIVVDFNPGKKFGNLVQKVNVALSRLKAGKLKAKGAAKLKWGTADVYNDGEKIGAKLVGGGEVSATLPKIDVGFEIPLPYGAGFKIELEAGRTGLTGSVDATYDESKRNAGSVKGSVRGGTTITGKAGPCFGSEKVAKATVIAGMQTDLSVQLTTFFEGKKWMANGVVGFDNSNVFVEAKLEFFGGEFEIFKDNKTVKALDWQRPIPVWVIADLN